MTKSNQPANHTHKEPTQKTQVETRPQHINSHIKVQQEKVKRGMLTHHVGFELLNGSQVKKAETAQELIVYITEGKHANTP